MKVVINCCYGGFGLSDECAVALGAKLKESSFGFTYHDWGNNRASLADSELRTNPKLIELMETKGSEWCSGSFASLKIVEIPDDVEWEVADYDGSEWIEEVHRTWC